jgi:hypothetical protein
MAHSTYTSHKESGDGEAYGEELGIVVEVLNERRLRERVVIDNVHLMALHLSPRADAPCEKERDGLPYF